MIDHLLCEFEDESMIRSYQSASIQLVPRGKQHKVPDYGKHEGAKLFAAICETGQANHRNEEEIV